MSKNLKEFSEGKIEARGVFRFSSSGTLTALLTILGLYKDTVPLTAGNYREQNNRFFRLSNMVTMSANIALVLFECNSTEVAGKHQFKVQLLVNEVPVGLPCCQGNMECTLEQFLSCYEEIVKGCDFDALCSPVSTTAGIPTSIAPVFQQRQEMIALSVIMLVVKYT